MTLETFFQKFDLLADAPGAVAKMRELVMQLAVEGGLVPHSSAESAVPYVSVEDAAPINVSDIPDSWRVVLLADAIKNRSGNSKLIKGKLHEEPAAGRFQGFSASGADVWCDDYEHEGQAIIISAVGARCGKAFKASGKWCAIANTNITRPEPSLFDFDFAYLVLNNEHFWIRGGSAQPFVKFPPSLARYFALPPLAEQKRIVAKVDELMALCDRLEAQQQEREQQAGKLARASLARFADAPTPANLPFLFLPAYAIPPADLRKSILTLAVQGKLVPQDPNDEPVSKLLARLVSLTAEDGRVPKPLLPIDEDVLPFDLPGTWEWVQAQDICRPSCVITYGVLKPVWVDVGVPTVRVQDMQGGIIVTHRIGQCSLERAAKFAKTILEAGDLLIAKDGATLGKTAFVPLSLAGGNITQHVLRFPITPHVERLFIRLVIDSPHGQAWMRSETKGVALPGVNVGDFRRMPIPIPPLAEQRRIVAKVEQLMTLVDELETQLAASRATAANLLDAVVAELTAA